MEKKMFDGMMGLVTGDALGVPVQFMGREEIRKRPEGPVIGMEGYGTYHMPAGSWSDDGSMALGTLSAIADTGYADPDRIMKNFVRWENDGAFTQYGHAYDEGGACMTGIANYQRTGDWRSCGKKGEYANGNGALMRILPACIYWSEKVLSGEASDAEALVSIHEITALTHDHLRAKIADGIYYFMVKGILKEDGQLAGLLQKGISDAKAFYGDRQEVLKEMVCYHRLFDLESFSKKPEAAIRSTGYVVDSLEAAVWCLITTGSLKDCLLEAVNLGGDTDTIAAIAGGLAGLFYGAGSIPEEWTKAIAKKEMFEEICSQYERMCERRDL